MIDAEGMTGAKQGVFVIVNMSKRQKTVNYSQAGIVLKAIGVGIIKFRLLL